MTFKYSPQLPPDVDRGQIDANWLGVTPVSLSLALGEWHLFVLHNIGVWHTVLLSPVHHSWAGEPQPMRGRRVVQKGEELDYIRGVCDV